MKEQCMICGSLVEDVSGICPVCGAVLGRSTQVSSSMGGSAGAGPVNNPNSGNNYGQPGYPNMGYGQVPYNYQNPGATGAGTPKKKVLLSVLSIVMAALAVLTVCIPALSLVLAIASIVLGIIALVKKQIKVPAILGLVFSGIAALLAVGVLIMNLMMYAVCGTNLMGIMEQSTEALEEGIQPLEDISFMIASQDGDYYFSLFDDGIYMVYFDSQSGVNDYIVSGGYESYGYIDTSVRDLIGYEVLGAMREGYRMKNVTCVMFQPRHSYEFDADGTLRESHLSSSSLEHMVFVVPDGYQKGSIIYQIEAGDEFDQELTPIYPSAGGMEDILPDDTTTWGEPTD
ncbi:MAG: hypothetical protein NC089_01195 [Bacteroides sp.]|nr:hypothetical protein [Bacteroides sp.]MCM1549829.1 hypothetical protein [Clostridium sp.]